MLVWLLYYEGIVTKSTWNTGCSSLWCLIFENYHFGTWHFIVDLTLVPAVNNSVKFKPTWLFCMGNFVILWFFFSSLFLSLSLPVRRLSLLSHYRHRATSSGQAYPSPPPPNHDGSSGVSSYTSSELIDGEVMLDRSSKLEIGDGVVVVRVVVKGCFQPSKPVGFARHIPSCLLAVAVMENHGRS